MQYKSGVNILLKNGVQKINSSSFVYNKYKLYINIVPSVAGCMHYAHLCNCVNIALIEISNYRCL